MHHKATQAAKQRQGGRGLYIDAAEVTYDRFTVCEQDI